MLVSKLAMWTVSVFLLSNLSWIDTVNQYMSASDVSGSQYAMTTAEMWAASFSLWHVPCSTCPWFTLVPDLLICFFMVHMMNPMIPSASATLPALGSMCAKIKNDCVQRCRCCYGDDRILDIDDELDMVELHSQGRAKRSFTFSSISSSAMSSESSNGSERETEWF